MKKILTTLAVSGIALGSYAQGYVNWSQSPGGNVISQTNSITYSGLSAALGNGAATGSASGAQGSTSGLAGNLYYYTLLYSTADTTTPTTLSDLAGNWSSTGLYMEDIQTANNGRQIPLSPTAAAEIDPTYTSGPLSLMPLVGQPIWVQLGQPCCLNCRIGMAPLLV
jgi:hypothetical protein